MKICKTTTSFVICRCFPIYIVMSFLERREESDGGEELSVDDWELAVGEEEDSTVDADEASVIYEQSSRDFDSPKKQDSLRF